MIPVMIQSSQAEEKMIYAGAPRISTNMRWYALVLASSFVFLYFDLFVSPQFPVLLGGDQVFFWLGAQRILSGQAIFLDFFQYTPPGTDLVYAAWFKIFGNQIWVTNGVVLTLGVLLAFLCFSLSRQIVRNTHALIATGLFLIAIYGMFLNATNHWFSLFFILAAVRVSMARFTARKIALSGASLALAAFFNQAHGVAALAGFILFLALSRAGNTDKRINWIKAGSILMLSFSLVILCLAAYYLVTAGFSRVWFCLVTSVFHSVGRSSRSLSFLGVPPGLSKLRLLPYLSVYLLLPAIYGFALLQCWRTRTNPSFPRNSILLLSLTGSSLLAEVAFSPNPLRLFAISMPGIILVMWAVEKFHLSTPVLYIGISAILTTLGLHQIIQKHRLCIIHSQLPGGRFAATPETYDKLHWLSQRVEPGDYFLQSGWSGVYLPLKVQSPIYMQTLSEWDCVTEKDIEPAIQQVDARRTRYVLWTRNLDNQCEFSTCNDYLTEFRRYLTAHFQPAHTFPDGDTVWQRRPEPGSNMSAVD